MTRSQANLESEESLLADFRRSEDLSCLEKQSSTQPDFGRIDHSILKLVLIKFRDFFFFEVKTAVITVPWLEDLYPYLL